MNEKELIADLIYNILGFGFYEGHSMGDISSTYKGRRLDDSEEAQNLLELGETIQIYDRNEGNKESVDLTKDRFIKEFIKYHDKDLPTDIKDLSYVQMDDLNEEVQSIDYTTGAAVLEICFCGEVIYG